MDRRARPAYHPAVRAPAPPRCNVRATMVRGLVSLEGRGHRPPDGSRNRHCQGSDCRHSRRSRLVWLARDGDGDRIRRRGGRAAGGASTDIVPRDRGNLDSSRSRRRWGMAPPRFLLRGVAFDRGVRDQRVQREVVPTFDTLPTRHWFSTLAAVRQTEWHALRRPVARHIFF